LTADFEDLVEIINGLYYYNNLRTWEQILFAFCLPSRVWLNLEIYFDIRSKK